MHDNFIIVVYLIYDLRKELFGNTVIFAVEEVIFKNLGHHQMNHRRHHHRKVFCRKKKDVNILTLFLQLSLVEAVSLLVELSFSFQSNRV